MEKREKKKMETYISMRRRRSYTNDALLCKKEKTTKINDSVW